jgi:D-inositol-3-phosphate glycosyltransferase
MEGASVERRNSCQDERASDRASPDKKCSAGVVVARESAGGLPPTRIGLLSVHTSPLEQPGTGDSGGMNVYLGEVASRLAEAGARIDIFTRTAGFDLPPTVTLDNGVRVHHIDAGPPTARKDDLASHLCAFYLGLAAHPAVDKLEVLHGHYWMSGWVGRQVSRRLCVPLVQTFHTLARAKNDALAPGDIPESPLRLVVEDRVVESADAIIAPTPLEAAMLRERYPARRCQVHVVEPGVDLSVFRPFHHAHERHVARQALGGGRIILFAGRLQPLKGPDIAVRTLAALDLLLPDDGLPVRLLIIGGASGNGAGTVDPESLRRLAAELGVADRVALLSARPQRELAALYRAADVVIMPSRSESFGLVALEAQACGTPVVAAAVGGLPHVIGDDGGGTVVAGYDPRAYAAALVPYLCNARARADASEAGRRRAARFTWERTAAATLQVYRRVLQCRAPDTAGASCQGA